MTPADIIARLQQQFGAAVTPGAPSAFSRSTICSRLFGMGRERPRPAAYEGAGTKSDFSGSPGFRRTACRRIFSWSFISPSRSASGRGGQPAT